MDKQPCAPSVGADVEWFLYNEETNRVETACGLVGGTKEKPLHLGHDYYVQEDNVMVEWNIPPVNDGYMFSNAISYAVDEVHDHVAAKVGPNYSIICKDEHTFEPEMLDSPQAKTFGCEPDYDAYLGGQVRPDGAQHTLQNVRTCGGHIHLGGDFQCPDFVAALFAELIVGCAGMIPINFKGTRQKWYGQPGIYRPKPYGIEYRTPDATWSDERALVEHIGQQAIKCSQYLTTSSATSLQAAFRHFPWLSLRDYMLGKYDGGKSRHRMLIMQTANNLGIPT